MSSNIFPGVYAEILDGNLGIARPPSVGDSVLIIGTAEDGPKNEPIQITAIDQLTDIFGAFGQGNLVRGVYETMYATDASIDVRAMRIGNGTRASLGLAEASGYVSVGYKNFTSVVGTTQHVSGIADVTYTDIGDPAAYINALTLTARYDGSKYNRFSVRIAIDNNPRSTNYGRNCILIYNDITKTESSYSYDYYNIYNTAAQVHNIEELAATINSDANLAPYITASTSELTAQFEVVASGTATSNSLITETITTEDNFKTYANTANNLKYGSAITPEFNSDGTVKSLELQLSHITTSRDADSDGAPDCIQAPLAEYGETTTIHVGPVGATFDKNIATAGNLVTELTKIYDIALSEKELLTVAGRDYGVLANYPINRNTSVIPSSDKATLTQLNGTKSLAQKGSFRQRAKGVIAGISTTGTETVFSFRAYLQPEYLVRVPAGTIPDVGTVSTYIYLTRAGNPLTEEEYNISVAAGHTTDSKILTYSGATDMRTKVYKTINGVTSEVTAGVTLTWSTTTKEATLTFTTAPEAGTIITIDYLSSESATLTEVPTRTSLEVLRGTSTSFLNYFVSGRNIYFAGAWDTDIEVSYDYKRVFDIPGDVSLTSPEMGKIKFTNTSKIPDITRTGGTRIGLQYTYKPEWLKVTGAQTLAGGGNGTNMTTLETKDALDTAYDTIENYEVDIVLPMGVHLDDTYDDISPETGIKRVTNAGFHTQLARALATMAANTAEVLGIIPVAISAGPYVTDTNTWVTKLTVPQSTDPNRAANYMGVFDSYRTQVVAANVIMSAARLGVNTVDYITDGATTYAGLLSGLSPQLPATNKYVGRCLLGLRGSLGRRQQETLVASRYVIFDNRPGLGIVVVKDVTSGIPGTDYNNLSTYRITKMVRDMVVTIGRGYIGSINTEQNRASLQAAINNALYNLTVGPNQALRKYNIRVTATRQDERDGIIWVDLVLFPVFGINSIYVKIRLSNAD